MVRYVLASGSPRRRELLEQVGLCFEISPAHGDERITKEFPADIVEELSRGKACEVAEAYLKKYEEDTTVIIGADTIVVHGDENGSRIMGKPKDAADAAAMLARLQGSTHQVYTGVTLVVIRSGEKEVITFHEKTDVHMYPMTQEQIAAYVATGEPMDKAGAYAIQGRCAAYIRGISGDYNNVVGLPVARLMQVFFGRQLI